MPAGQRTVQFADCNSSAISRESNNPMRSKSLLCLADRPFVDEAVTSMKEHQHTLRSLIHYIATSKPFLTK